MPTPDDLRGWIAAGLECDRLEVSGDGRHFEALIVSPLFEGKRPVQRQQLVYAALSESIANGSIHAVNIRTFTPAQWQARG